MSIEFPCKDCDYKANITSNLERHQKSVHQGQKLQCNYEETQKGSLATHQKSVHLGQKFQCPYCDFEATRKGS